MVEPNKLTVTSALEKISAGRISISRWIESCIERIQERESLVRAWESLDIEYALNRAYQLDSCTNRSLPLNGLPIGIKDVIDSKEYRTTFGSPIYKAYQPEWDAAVVSALKGQGCFVLGKTVTTEFAMRSPGPTRNPLDLKRTPGGSSSGSAAAVADFMVPIALGTQTVGSVIRPGAYCGVIAFKPSLGWFQRIGVKILSESNDTIGVFARDIKDIAFVMSALGVVENYESIVSLDKSPKIAFCKTPFWEEIAPEVQNQIISFVDEKVSEGALLVDITLPREFDRLPMLQEIIAEYEIYQSLCYERINHKEKLSNVLVERLNKASKITREEYFNALKTVRGLRSYLDYVFRDVDIIFAPSAQGEAPLGYDTGSPIFSKFWQPLGVPCLAFPIGYGPNEMPIGLQAISNYGEDSLLLASLIWINGAHNNY